MTLTNTTNRKATQLRNTVTGNTQNSVNTQNGDGSQKGSVIANGGSKEALGSFDTVYMPAKKPIVMLNSRVMQSSSIDNGSKHLNLLVAGESTQHADSQRELVNIEIMKQKN